MTLKIRTQRKHVAWLIPLILGCLNFYFVQLVIAQNPTDASPNQVQITPADGSNKSTGILKEYLQNEKGEVIGAVLENGVRVRFFDPEPLRITENFRPVDGIQVSLYKFPTDSKIASKLPACDKQGFRVEAPFILRLLNLKTGGICVPSPPPCILYGKPAKDPKPGF